MTAISTCLPHSFENEVLSTKNDEYVIRSNVRNILEADAWVKEFGKLTKTHWIVRSSAPQETARLFCSKRYHCHFSSYNKTRGSERTKDSSCGGKIRISVKLTTPYTKKKDVYVKRGMVAVIKIFNHHNHDTAESLYYLPPPAEVKADFFQYFSEGYGISESKSYHEKMIELKGGNIRENLADNSINPKYRTIRHWREEWKKKFSGQREDQEASTKMKNGYRCAFSNCQNSTKHPGKSFHRFPKDEIRCQAWVEASKNPRLADMTAPYLYTNFRVCQDHFSEWCFMSVTDKRNLVHNAIPCEPSTTFDRQEDTSSMDTSIISVPFPNSIKTETVDELQVNQSQVSQLQISEVVSLAPVNQKSSQSQVSSPSNAFIVSLSSSDIASATGTSVRKSTPIETEMAKIIIKQNDALLKLKTKNTVLTESNVQAFTPSPDSPSVSLPSKTYIHYLPSASDPAGNSSSHSNRRFTPKEAEMAKIIRKQNDALRKLKKRNKVLRDHLKKSKEELIKSYLVKSNIDKKLADFIVRQVKLKKSGKRESHRFTYDEKMFAYNILCKSQEAYHVLKTLIELPSLKTLQRFVDTKPGVNCDLIEWPESLERENCEEM